MAAITQKLDRRRRLQLLQIITHVGALIPLLLLYIDYYTYNLGADEIRAAILRTGKPALYLLILSLAITPLNTLLGWKILLPLRKPLGLYAFMYVVLHLGIFAWIDFGLNWSIVWAEIVQRQYALAGFASFLILIPLAVTSTKWSMRKLGKNWKRLHRTVYVAAILAVIHYIWLVKQSYTEPALFALALIAFLVLRITPVKKRVASWRRQLTARRR